MDTRNFDIVPEKVVEDLRDKKNPSANFFKKIPDDLLGELQGMNRAQRRDWYRKNKKLLINEDTGVRNR